MTWLIDLDDNAILDILNKDSEEAEKGNFAYFHLVMFWLNIILDVVMANAPDSPYNPQGSSQAKGGYICGKAVGSTFNFADPTPYSSLSHPIFSVKAQVVLFVVLFTHEVRNPTVPDAQEDYNLRFKRQFDTVGELVQELVLKHPQIQSKFVPSFQYLINSTLTIA